MKWKDIKGFEGLYEISNTGKVRSKDREITYSNGRVHKYKGEEKKIQVRKKTGYNTVNLFKNQKYVQKYVHILVAEAFIPEEEGKTQINHKDGNKSNNTVENLERCTPKENIQHAFKTNLSINSRGEKSNLSKITEKQALEIMNLLDTGYSRKEIVKKTGVKYSTIKRIHTNETWKHVKHQRKYLKD